MAGPTWYDDNYLYRAPIVVDGSATAAGTVDATITIPETHPFWLTVQSTGYDVRFTTNNGYTLLAYNRATWTYASKVGIFNIDAITHHVTNSMTVIWMYWGYSGATDGSTSPTISGALNAYLHVGGPVSPRFDVRLEEVGTETPPQQLQKTVADIVQVSWRITDLATRQIPWEGSNGYEGPRTIMLEVDPAATYNTSSVRIFLWNDQLWLKTLLSGGSDGSNFKAVCRVYTTEERLLIGSTYVVVESM
jgi:hypothetical protein